MQIVKIDLAGRSYNIYIEKGLLSNLKSVISSLVSGKKVAIVTDENVNRLYGKKVSGQIENSFTIEVPAGEGSKSIATLTYVYDKLLEGQITRSDIIIALGGGVVGDLTGFAASTVLRGVPYIQIPTTLLAQVDSSVGGKTAVNLERGKNLVGTFYQPLAVVIDPDCLKLLPRRELSSGMAEIIKYGAIKSRSLFEKLLICEDVFNIIEEVIAECCGIKGAIVSSDEFDRGERMLLNFGHTIGHALEKTLGYGEWSHGEAVALGMCVMAAYGEKKGITKKGSLDAIIRLNKKFNLPYFAERKLFLSLEDSIKYDKKSDGDSLNIVLLHEIGNAFIKKIDRSEIKEILGIAGE